MPVNVAPARCPRCGRPCKLAARIDVHNRDSTTDRGPWVCFDCMIRILRHVEAHGGDPSDYATTPLPDEKGDDPETDLDNVIPLPERRTA